MNLRVLLVKNPDISKPLFLRYYLFGIFIKSTLPTQGVHKVGSNGTLGSILLFFKRTFSKMLQINWTVPFLLMLCQHLVCAIFFSNVCAFCPIQECLCKKNQKVINITQWDKIYVCLGCLFGSVFKMSVWVVSVCLGVFSKCLFGLSLSVWESFKNVCLGCLCLFGLSLSVWECFPNVCLGCLFRFSKCLVGCLFGSLFGMSVWVVCLGVFSECLFRLSVQVFQMYVWLLLVLRGPKVTPHLVISW